MVTTRQSSRSKSKKTLEAFGERSFQRVLGIQSVGIQWLGLATIECYHLRNDVCRIQQAVFDLKFCPLMVMRMIFVSKQVSSGNFYFPY